MNANELADMAENACCAYQKEIAAMLRQQSDLIDLLRMGQPNIDYDKELLKPMFVGRELTDEEIIWVYQNLWQFLPSEEPDLAKDIKKFARAILRKAQEK